MGKNIIVLFELGQLVATTGANAALMEVSLDPLELVQRHMTDDWRN